MVTVVASEGVALAVFGDEQTLGHAISISEFAQFSTGQHAMIPVGSLQDKVLDIRELGLLASVQHDRLADHAQSGDTIQQSMKPQLEYLEPESITESSSAGLTPMVIGHVLNYTTRDRFGLINLTQQVEELVGKSGIREGMVLVQSLHSTAAVFVNEWQEALLKDFRTLLEQAVRADAPWRHNDRRYSDCDRSNAASHLRALLTGTSAVLAVRDGHVVRGTWQSIILAELDGPRTRSVSLQVLGV